MKPEDLQLIGREMIDTFIALRREDLFMFESPSRAQQDEALAQAQIHKVLSELLGIAQYDDNTGYYYFDVDEFDKLCDYYGVKEIKKEE